jgi:hypothetical protein
MLSVEDWAEIRRLYRAEGLPKKVIARVLGISVNTVKAALACNVPPKYERPPRGSIVDEVEPSIRELLQSHPRMPATVIAERIEWTRSIRVLSARVAELRPVYPAGSGVADGIAAGEIAQCDLWFPDRAAGGVGSDPQAGGVAGADHDLRVLALAVGLLIPSRRAEDLFAGWWRLVEQLGRSAGAGVGRRGRDPDVGAPGGPS